ncbi:putative uncharacterized protein [Xanthomonas citri pv. punicae str. LMG 859]|nr:putative uncharacterized protein [Xanthomonas citri pv. punicae str. LMG 859]
MEQAPPPRRGDAWLARPTPHAVATCVCRPTRLGNGALRCGRCATSIARGGVMSSASPLPLAWFRRPWLGVLARTLAAIFGGYALASTTNLLLALVLPMPRSEAVLSSMLIGIVVRACAPLWAFATASVWRAWAGIAVPATLMFALAAWLQRSAA